LCIIIKKEGENMDLALTLIGVVVCLMGILIASLGHHKEITGGSLIVVGVFVWAFGLYRITHPKAKGTS
jgi:uncharacterized membrane protein